MSFSIATTLLIKALSISRDLIINLAANKIWQKFDQDLETVIFKLIQTQQRQFKDQFPEATLDLKPAEIKPVFERYFGNLTAADLDAPLTPELLAPVFAHLWLQPRFREKGGFEAIDPKYRNALLTCARNFMDQFKRNATAAFERNSAAATAILLNSLAQAGKNDQEIVSILQKILRSAIDLPLKLEKDLQLILQQVIQSQLQLEFNRFRDDWKFIFQVIKGETTEAEEAEKEWLTILKQVLEWKEFQHIQPIQLKNVRGELFEMELPNALGVITPWICWGYPRENDPQETEVELAITKMKAHPDATYFVITQQPLSGIHRQSLKQHGISQILTLDTFVDTLFNINPYCQTQVNDYEQQDIFQHYIDLMCHTRDQKDEVLNLQDYFLDWLKVEKRNQIALLGDFGTGKTEFCRRMQWNLLKNYHSNQTLRLPVIITLRDQKGVKLPQMIANIMNEMGLKKIDYPAFRTLSRLGRFVILIDGFDEMDPHAVADEMRHNFQTLYVLAEGKAKVLLTSRTHYFEHLTREKEIISADFQTIYLNLFTEAQIKAYAEKICESRQAAKNIFTEIEVYPQIKELMRTPVLLDMILKIFPELAEYKGKIDLALIYQRATQRWLKKAQAEGRLENLTADEAITFMQELAWQMHQENDLKIKYTRLRSQTYEKYCERLKIPDKSKVDAIFGELRTCTFLNRDDEGYYKFVHKSFMEFFVAVKIYNDLQRTDFKNLMVYFSPKILTSEILVFLMQMNRALLYKALLEIIESHDQRHGKFALEILKKYFYQTLNRSDANEEIRSLQA